MTQLNTKFFKRQFANGEYSPLISLMIKEKMQEGKFSYMEIYETVSKKLEEFNQNWTYKALNELRDCLDKFRDDGYLKESAGMYYPTDKVLIVKSTPVVMDIKKGLDVRTTKDLQNLVTSIILRQSNTFTRKSIEEKTRKQLEEFKLWTFSDEALSETVKNTIEILDANNFLRMKENAYILKNIL